ncbi:M14 family zinc carboxypeptidase [Stackebrandtia nassauensis]|uniref:Peptidase M14 carboxypeptidase A n=1 Tax=Stackebrandtia nassauensis (strain DSM 44728 / CIP 108903 / NRRL B-16338 / NBRC 102104 / LLR-40K-21) TaxID=446470 RepID=D3PX83_STANL|nr:M14 family zinc carboxypeptidase [Stackebrandtia nassauensis]ADD41346.1 peptidase M14 carboxypeptidase A [Stackebrandtia nassauensis DSM 44728]
MRSKKIKVSLLAVTALTLSGLTASPAAADGASEPLIWEVPDVSVSQAIKLTDAGFDVIDYEDDGELTVVGDRRVAKKLRDRGFEPRYVDTVYKDVEPSAKADAFGTYYGGYKTPDLHLKHLDDVAAAKPNLAQVYDIGNSWRKTVGQGGHDIKAICLTNRQPGDCQLSPNSTKPRISIISQIHAREIATGEITWRWIDYLANGYGSNAKVTQLLNSTEVWVVPIVNPDGVDIVASGGNSPRLQRKNANNTYGSCSGTQRGVDLNRNHTHKWGGASSQPCAETYQGPRRGSEPEIAAIEGFFAKIHPDQRGPGDTDPAPANTRDVMISLHSYGNYIIVPWGYTTTRPPNDSALRSLGQRMAASNGYRVGNAAGTVGYLASGTTDDFTYGAFGIASFTYEVGGGSGQCGGFLPAYSCLDSSLWPINRDAIMTGALDAASPYS